MSLRLKTILGIALIEAVLLMLLVSMTLDYLRSTNYDGLMKRANTTATLFATTTKDAVLSYDLASLESFATEVLKNPDLIYARVTGPSGSVFASAGDEAALSREFVADLDVEQVSDGIFDTFAEIAEGGEVYGRVELGLDFNSLAQVIREAEQRSAYIAASEMVLVALFSLILGTYLTNQLHVLRAAASRISEGELNVSIPIKGKDEVADVARAFNAMAENLAEASARRDDYEAQLTELNKSLEDRVERRTRQLASKNEELEGANQAIKETQGQLLQSEKMASVGQLAAGVAHEINNPLGFVMSNIGTLEGYVNNYRQLVTTYQSLISEKDLPKKKDIYRQIKAMEVEFDLEFMEEDIDELLEDTKEGSTRVKEIVKGLKAFSHVDKAEVFELTNLNECIETTLKVAANELKYHCEILTDLGDIPQTYCLPGPIKQVLLNMALNAGHAIKEKGQITFVTRQVGSNIEIDIRDTGSGIDEQHLSKLFEPFFTTKPVGKGTGLGLSISYGIIVDKHNGDIRVESEVGKGTCFTLVLPVLQSPPEVTDKDSATETA